MAKLIRFILAFASFVIAAGLQISGVEVRWLGYTLIVLGVSLLIIPAWPIIGRFRLRSPVLIVANVASPNPLRWRKLSQSKMVDVQECVEIKKGWMDFYEDGEIAVKHLARLTSKIGTLTEKQTRKMDRHVAKIKKRGGDISKVRIEANRMGIDLNCYAEELSVNTAEMEKHAEEFSINQRGFMAWKTEDPDRMAENERQEAIELFRSTAIAATGFKTTLETIVDDLDAM